MAKYVYVQDFGSFKAGDVVDVPDGAKVPKQFLVPAPADGAAPAPATPPLLSAEEQAVADAEKELADAKAAEAEAEKGGV